MYISEHIIFLIKDNLTVMFEVEDCLTPQRRARKTSVSYVSKLKPKSILIIHVKY